MERYNRTYTHGTATFELSYYVPNIEECRFLILKVVEQSVRDYLSLFGSNLPNDIAIWETAVGFIFDSEYKIVWGNMELSLEDYLGIVDIDVDWFRERISERFKERHGKYHGT
jgi:hypothetical protein